MPSGATMYYRFGTWELDSARGCLSCAGNEITLRRKAFLLLSYLLTNRDRLVPRDELVGAVWPGLHVSDTTVASTLHEVRATLRAGDAALDFVRTVHGRGYRFVGDVDVVGRGAARGDPFGP